MPFPAALNLARGEVVHHKPGIGARERAREMTERAGGPPISTASPAGT